MKFFFKCSDKPTNDYKALKASTEAAFLAGRNYSLHIQRIGPKLPPETRDFVMSSSYRDWNSHDCPHDAWLQDLVFKVEPDAIKRQSLRIVMVLLGSFHDRILGFEYRNVIECDIDISRNNKKSPGDWLYDEFDVEDDGFITHEILWQFGNPWKITAEKILFSASDK
jgi:hypothetical protein